MTGLLIDFGQLPDAHCNHHVDLLYKALASDPDGSDKPMWRPVENPWITAHVEAATRRFQRILEAVQNAIATLLTGHGFGELAKSDALPWLRWSEAQFLAARLHLESRSPADYTLDDWLMTVDWLIQRFLPDAVINTEAEYLTVRAAILGKVQAALEAGNQPTPAEVAVYALRAPKEIGDFSPRAFTVTERSMMDFARARAAAEISDVAESARRRMKDIIVQHLEAQLLNHKGGSDYEKLRSALFDQFGALNRDFRRIAVTEAGECQLQGFVGAQKPGTRLKRLEAYYGACEFCRAINGRVFRVVAPDDPKRDGDRDVWIGKTNIGRSPAPRKREGGHLVARVADELWWVAAGVQHPHCRGSWSPISDAPANVNAAFAEQLEAAIKRTFGPGAAA